MDSFKGATIMTIAIDADWLQERARALQPYLVTKIERGIVGKSIYAAKLRQQIHAAAGDRQATIIFGEPGLEKDNIAALIHFGSAQRREPMIKVNCNLLSASGSELFGRVDKPGLLDWLGNGTLLLNNIQDLAPELMPRLVELLSQQTYTPVSHEVSHEGSPPASPRSSPARILMVAERTLPAIECCVGHLIKVPPLRVRKEDIKPKVEYYLSLYCRAKGIPQPTVSPEAMRRLQRYNYPGNGRELRSLVERAIVQAAGATTLVEEVFWNPEPKGKRYRLNLLNAYPWLRQFLRGSWWTDRLNYGIVLPLYAIVVAILFWGPQTRDHNIGLNLFWAWWWVGVLLTFPIVGRLWCAVCPFMIYGEVAQKLSLWLFPRKLKHWNRPVAERWGGWFLVGLFALIYLWEELWDLPNTAYLSAWLLLLITAGAVICSVLFERRFWCRYLCPIGGMNGLFAKLSVTELRAQQGTCSAECTTYQCYKGGPEKGEGLETGGCPLYSHPAQLQDNRDCVLCMTCLKACPHRSVEVNLRPPAIELWTTHTPRSYEVALLLLLLSGIFLHRLPTIQTWLGTPEILDAFVPHLELSLLVLVVPAIVPLLAHGAIWLIYHGRRYWQQQAADRATDISSDRESGNQSLAASPPIAPRNPKPRRFLEVVYGYLPLVLGGNLAHHLQTGLAEAGRLLPVAWATVGLDGTALPVIVAHPAVIAFLQGTTLLLAMLLTFVLTQKIAHQSVRLLLPHHIATVGLGMGMWAAIVN